jgi:hypothetical protein
VEEGGAAARRVEQVLARRWATSARKGAVEFLVKFKGLSYLHVAWCREAQLLREDPKLLARLKAFARVAPPLPPPPAAEGGLAADASGVGKQEGVAEEAASAEVAATLSLSSAFAAAAGAPTVRLTLNVRTAAAAAATAAAAAAAAAGKGGRLSEQRADDLAEYLPERALEVEQVLATRSGADGCAECLVKWEVLPWSESSWERQAELPPNPNPNPAPNPSPGFSPNRNPNPSQAELPPCAAQLAAFDAVTLALAVLVALALTPTVTLAPTLTPTPSLP